MSTWTYGQARSTTPPARPMPTTDTHDYQPRHPETAKLAERVFSSQARAGRAYGGIKGYNGKPGGWIYNQQGRVLAQGWAALVNHHVYYDKLAKGYRFGGVALRKLDEYLDRQAAQA